MGNAMFKVVINEITEDRLGPILGALPDGIHPEIMRTQGRDEVVTVSKPRTLLPQNRVANVAMWVQGMPQRFTAKAFSEVIAKNGYNANSISHFIRRCVQARLIRKVPGTAGSNTLYEKVYTMKAD